MVFSVVLRLLIYPTLKKDIILEMKFIETWVIAPVFGPALDLKETSTH